MKHGETVGGYRIVRRKRMARGEGTRVSLDDPSAGVEASVDSDAAAIVDVKRRLARRRVAVEWALTKTALSAQSKAVYRAHVIDERPIGDVAAEFKIPRRYANCGAGGVRRGTPH